MKMNVSSIPGYRIFEYLLIVYPHEEMRNRISKIRQDFSEKFKTDYSKWGKPHLALATFNQYELMEERVLHRLGNIAMGYPPFKVELKDFGSFPSHTIYINVTSKVPVQSLVKEIRMQVQRLMKLDEEHKPHFMLEPHMAIARKLLPWQYEKGWLELSHKHFTGKFIADGMTLLKRPSADPNSYRGKYQFVQKWAFENMPVQTKQGELFR
jgi:2'-5' RNA ligase